MKNILIAAGISAACLVSLPVLAQPGAPEAIKTCQNCHGARGDSTVTTTPRLNGQRADYIVARLKAFLDVTRETPHASYSMWQVVTNLNDSARAGIANYYAGQAPTAPKPGALAAEGRKTYENGVAASNIPACRSCHGASGEGKGAVPRLAGQHADYLKTQMWVFSFQLRENDAMHPNTKNMTGAQIDALASYLSNN